MATSRGLVARIAASYSKLESSTSWRLQCRIDRALLCHREHCRVYGPSYAYTGPVMPSQACSATLQADLGAAGHGSSQRPGPPESQRGPRSPVDHFIGISSPDSWMPHLPW